MNKPHIYPAYCFDKAVTYSQWVKLSIADIHDLTQETGFKGQNVFFYLNHPIRFVTVVAPVVAIDNVGEKYGLLTLDDGSGHIIVAKLNLLDKEISSQIDCPSNTVISNVNFRASLGSFDVEIDGITVEIGTIIKAKCTLELFRGAIQLILKRVTLIKNTSEEITAWKDLAIWKKGVLSRPWTLTPMELKVLEKDENLRVQRFEEETKKRQTQLLAKKAEENIKRQKREIKRRMREMAMNEGALI